MISKLDKYIQNHSSANIRNRANSIFLDVVSKNEEYYLFSYKGSEKKPYKIEVFYTENSARTSCTCPYDFGGMCKHEVAAINFVIDELTVKPVKKDLFGIATTNREEIVQKKYDEIFLQDHHITKKLIQALASESKVPYLNEYYIQILAFNDNTFRTSYNSYPVYKQQLKYDPDTFILNVTCTCRESKVKNCVHILSAIESIVNDFGETIFFPDFIATKKQEFLNNYGLLLTDDYQKFFDLSFGINGLEVVEKVKNIVPTLEVAVKNLIPKLEKKEEDGFLLPLQNNVFAFENGIGFCFELYKIQGASYFKFTPFTAKYKKNSEEFISTFREISPNNFVEKLADIADTDKSILLKALGFAQIHQLFLNKFSLENYRDAYIQFNNLVQSASEYPFYIKKNKDTLVKNNLTEVQFSKESPILSFTFTETEDLFTLKPRLNIEGKNYQLNSSKVKIFPFFCLFENTIYIFKTPNEFLYINRLQERSEINFFKKDKEKLYVDFLKPISKHFDIDTKVYAFAESKAEQTLKKQIYLSDFEGEYIIFKLAVLYNETMVFLHSKEHLYDEKTQTIIKRNETFESEFLEEFKELHPDFEDQDSVFYLKPYQLMDDQWLLKASQKMERKNMTVFGAKDLKSFKYNLNKPTISMGVKSGTDWFDLTIEINYGNQNVSLKDIKKALLKKSNYVLLSDGTLGVLPKEWLTKFSKYFKAGEVKNKDIKISNYQFNIIDELYEDIKNAPDFLLELQRKQHRLLNLKQLTDIAIPKQLKATLRPYQKEGLNWLVFLDENKLGGCLADDMGLGKTIQVIAFLAYLKSLHKENTTHLVVAPTSLIFNWENEIKKFCPSLKTHIYTGANRKDNINDFHKSDVILTTYGSVLNDVETLKNIEFNYVILDESQAIKNPNSKRYKAVRMLKCKNKLSLTGTPIENNTFDLYAQMNFLNPGLLGTMSHFKTEFSDAIDKAKNEEAAQLLSKMIHPFLLRRTKKQVATELPEKTESIIYCEMGSEQRKVYNFFKDKYRDYLLQKIVENGVENSQMYVLEGLTKLRQICNSPELLNEEEDYGKSSVKLDLLIESIKNKTADHKVLVFSQFTTMLQLIKDRLDNENIAYEYLDGKTQKREEKVINFQETEELRVFLISIKAGGVGLNLTAADYVFLVDPWWNPAVESQAIDRSYRIGQTKHVMAYKMICKDTIEEKIVDLQKRKKQVSDAIIQIDKAKKSFDVNEIKALFS